MKIISGGQTGVDRAALDAAADVGLPCAGTVPKGRRAEDGRIPDRYPVQEGASSRYADRTRRNVLDADATLILCRGVISGGTQLTVELAETTGKPFCVVDLSDPQAPRRASEFIARVRPQTLNVAGPRESSDPGIGSAARNMLANVFADALK